MPRRKTPTIYVVSDGRGETAEQVVKAAALQFENRSYRLSLKHDIRSPDQVGPIVERAAERGGVIFYTLVADETRRAIKKLAAEHLVPTVDILGPAFGALHDLFHAERRARPGLLYSSERERFDRMRAIDYTLTHDDGQRPHELSRADVVLAGVSRASKSSTCFFLAYQGIRAANVPLIQGLAPPPQLLRLPKERVVGLRINVARLITVREARVHDKRFGHVEGYLDKRAVAREVLYANRIMDENDWASVDVSYLAIEEIAAEVIRLRGLRNRVRW